MEMDLDVSTRDFSNTGSVSRDTNFNSEENECNVDKKYEHIEELERADEKKIVSSREYAYSMSSTLDEPAKYKRELFYQHANNVTFFATGVIIFGLAFGILTFFAMTEASLGMGITMIIFSVLVGIWGLHNSLQRQSCFFLIFGLVSTVISVLLIWYFCYCMYIMIKGFLAEVTNVKSFLQNDPVVFPTGLPVKAGVSIDAYLGGIIEKYKSFGVEIDIDNLPVPKNLNSVMYDSMRLYTAHKYHGTACCFAGADILNFRRWPVGCASTCGLKNTGENGYNQTLENFGKLEKKEQFLCLYYEAFTGAQLLFWGFHFWWLMLILFSIMSISIAFCCYAGSSFHGFKAYVTFPYPSSTDKK